MFYGNMKNMFDQINPSMRPFIKNIVLTWMFCLLIIASVNLKPENSIDSLLPLFAIASLIINIFFGSIISKYNRVYLFYLFVSIGGFITPTILLIGALEMLRVSWDATILFWGLFGTSIVVLFLIYFNALDYDFLKRNIISQKPRFTWNINLDLYADANKKYGTLTNLVRIFIAPFAPAIGIALSRSLEGNLEWSISGITMFFFALIFNTGYIKFLALGFKFLYWQKMLNSDIFIADEL